MRRTALAALVVALLATGCGSDDTSMPMQETKPGATVDMKLTLFAPAEASIKAGETLTFVNANAITHVIVGGTYTVGSDGQRTAEKDDGTFKLDVSEKGDTVSHTFTTAGTFQFFCTIHKAMNGTVTVT